MARGNQNCGQSVLSIKAKHTMKDSNTRRRLPLIVLCIIVGLMVTGTVRQCCGDRRSQLVQTYSRPSGDTLSVAIEMSPLTYTFENDTAEGFDYSIITALADSHNLPVKFCPVGNLEDAYRGLYDGKYDLLVGTMPATVRLREFFPLTDAVYLDRQVLVQRADTSGSGAVKSQLDLRGDTVYIAAGSPLRLRLQNMARELGDTIHIVELPGLNSEHLVIMAASGDIPRAVVSSSVARRLATDYSELDTSVPLSLNQFQVWAVAPGDSLLLDSLNLWLREFRQTAAYDSLCARYL